MQVIKYVNHKIKGTLYDVELIKETLKEIELIKKWKINVAFTLQ